MFLKLVHFMIIVTIIKFDVNCMFSTNKNSTHLVYYIKSICIDMTISNLTNKYYISFKGKFLHEITLTPLMKDLISNIY